ncbi:MAG TPA: copper chaperone PCu(A)C [Rhizomicrobium sp.]
MKKHLFELAAAAILIAAPVSAAHAANAADLVLKDGWFRTLPGNLPAGGYFALHNGGTAVATITGAESPACGMLMLHKSESEGGAMKMVDVASVPVPVGGDVTFAPGGYHLMCMDTKPTMKPGTMVPVTLDFADGSKVKADFAVKNAKGQ